MDHDLGGRCLSHRQRLVTEISSQLKRVIDHICHGFKVWNVAPQQLKASRWLSPQGSSFSALGSHPSEFLIDTRADIG